LAILAASSSAAESSGGLVFARRSQPVAERSLAVLQQRVGAGKVRVFDPYEGDEIVFDAFRFDQVLDFVYGSDWRSEEELLFTCSDGYQPTVPVARVLEHEAWLAFDRSGMDGFTLLKLESGSRQRIQLGPYYLVWENVEDEQVRQQGDYGWPYQLVGVDLIRARDRFPAMQPPVGASEDAVRGFAQFRMHCSRCHAINGDGGGIGPELNHPVNPTEVREHDWLVRWIDDPSQILPTARMPRLNPALPDRARVIDQLLAYLGAMAATGPPAESKP